MHPHLCTMSGGPSGCIAVAANSSPPLSSASDAAVPTASSLPIPSPSAGPTADDTLCLNNVTHLGLEDAPAVLSLAAGQCHFGAAVVIMEVFCRWPGESGPANHSESLQNASHWVNADGVTLMFLGFDLDRSQGSNRSKAI